MCLFAAPRHSSLREPPHSAWTVLDPPVRVTSGMGRLERMKLGSGLKDREDTSSSKEILMCDVFVEIVVE